GTVLPGNKVPRLAGARVLYRDGIALAALVAGKVDHLVEPLPIEAREAKRLLLREPESPSGGFELRTDALAGKAVPLPSSRAFRAAGQGRRLSRYAPLQLEACGCLFPRMLRYCRMATTRRRKPATATTAWTSTSQTGSSSRFHS